MGFFRKEWFAKRWDLFVTTPREIPSKPLDKQKRTTQNGRNYVMPTPNDKENEQRIPRGQSRLDRERDAQDVKRVHPLHARTGEADEPAYDDVTAPAHYLEGKTIEPIDVIEDWKLGAHTSAALKYISRWQKKDGVKSLKKAVYYLQRKIDNIENGKDNGHA